MLKEEVQRLSEAAKDAAKALQEEKQLSEALRTRLQEMIAAESSRDGAEQDAEALRQQHTADVAVLKQEIERLNDEIKASSKASAENSKQIEALQALLTAEKAKVERSLHSTALLEKERIRLETELSEAVRGHAQNLQQRHSARHHRKDYAENDRDSARRGQTKPVDQRGTSQQQNQP